MAEEYNMTLDDAHEAMMEDQLANAHQQMQSQAQQPGLLENISRVPRELAVGQVAGGEDVMRGLHYLPMMGPIAPLLKQFSEHLPSTQTLEEGVGLKNVGLPGKIVETLSQFAAPGAIAGVGAGKVIGKGVSNILKTFKEPGAIEEQIKGLNTGLEDLVSHTEKYGKDFIEELGKGMTKSQNQQSAAADIKGGIDRRYIQDAKNYEPINQAVGDKNVKPFTKDFQEMFNPNVPEEKLSKDQKQIIDSIPRETRKMITDRLKPSTYSHGEGGELNLDQLREFTFNDAHEIQSKLAADIRKLERKREPDVLTENHISALKDLRSSLLNGMYGFLKKESPQLADQYNFATNWHYNNIAPIKANKDLLAIGEGKLKNPGNLTSIFKDPEESTRSLVSELNPEFKNKLIYNEMLKAKKGYTPEKAIGSYEGLEQKGLGDYIGDHIHENMNRLKENMSRIPEIKKNISEAEKLHSEALKKKTSAKTTLKHVGLYGGGAALGYDLYRHLFGGH